MNLLIKTKAFGIPLLLLVATNILTYYLTKDSNPEPSNSSSDIYAEAHTDCSVKVKRLNGYSYIRPMLFVDSQCESDKLAPVKKNITTLIDEYKRIGTLNSASVFLKEYSGDNWIAINGDEKFLPGSLMKVPELITILKMEELNPGFLNKKLTFNTVYNLDKHPKYLGKSIRLGQSYTVRELLNFMIVHSDNNATSLLFANMDLNLFKKVFTDVGLATPDLTAQHYPVSANDFSKFMRILYNSSYLNNKNSEFATELLGKCNFKEGLVSGLPASIKVAHKFGESGDPTEKQFSESAIVYLDNNSYILTVMVKGKDFSKLTDVIKQISGIVYQDMFTFSKMAI